MAEYMLTDNILELIGNTPLRKRTLAPDGR